LKRGQRRPLRRAKFEDVDGDDSKVLEIIHRGAEPEASVDMMML
jgi:hypothetical protein